MNDIDALDKESLIKNIERLVLDVEKHTDHYIMLGFSRPEIKEYRNLLVKILTQLKLQK